MRHDYNVKGHDFTVKQHDCYVKRHDYTVKRHEYNVMRHDYTVGGDVFSLRNLFISFTEWVNKACTYLRSN